MALGFGVASGLGPVAGLYCAIIISLFAAVFGGTATQAYGPTGPTTVIVASIVAANSNNPAVVFVIIALCGLFQISFGVFKIGSYIKLIPRAVVSGFMTGVGCIIIILQSNTFLGLPAQGNVLKAISSLMAIDSVNIHAVALGAATLLILILFRKVGQIVPLSFLALVVCTLASTLLGLDVATIGEISGGLPVISISPIGAEVLFLLNVVGTALALSLLTSVDTLLTSLIADRMTKTQHDSNKELIGCGLGNMFSGIFGGMAGSSSTISTVANIRAGASTKLSGATHALVLILILFLFKPAAQVIPYAVLAAILIKVGIDVIDYSFFNNLRHIPLLDIMVKITVLLITVFGNLIVAVAVGITLYKLLRRFTNLPYYGQQE